MRLIDDSPASFLAICFVVVYAVVGVEAAMWMISTVAFVALTFLVLAAVAGVICMWMIRLLEDGAPATVPAAAPAPVVAPVAPRPTVVAAPARRAVPQPGGRLVHT